LDSGAPSVEGAPMVDGYPASKHSLVKFFLTSIWLALPSNRVERNGGSPPHQLQIVLTRWAMQLKVYVGLGHSSTYETIDSKTHTIFQTGLNQGAKSPLVRSSPPHRW